ncbi:hypothetical protein E1189_02470 [Sansalvadorimonas verongulae]|nr:hypothetical protein [Sansalvadorimonas verongulae]
MDAFVFDEIAGCDKRFVAPVNWTAKGPVSCVGAFMGTVRLWGWIKRLLHPSKSQTKGLSPVWMRLWAW